MAVWGQRYVSLIDHDDWAIVNKVNFPAMVPSMPVFEAGKTVVEFHRRLQRFPHWLKMVGPGPNYHQNQSGYKSGHSIPAVRSKKPFNSWRGMRLSAKLASSDWQKVKSRPGPIDLPLNGCPK